MTDQTTPPYIVYILCDTARRAQCRHYVGITTPRTLRRRMRDHANGRASVTTARMIAQGAQLRLALMIPANRFSEERRLKQAGHYERLCPICKGTIEPHQAEALPEPSPQWSTNHPSDPWHPLDMVQTEARPQSTAGSVTHSHNLLTPPDE